MDALIDSIGFGIMQLLGFTLLAVITIVLIWAKRVVSRLVQSHFVVEEIQNDQKITELLVEVRLAAKADRVCIYLFHNGEHYISGSSILRISGAYETVAFGISMQRLSAQSILISTVPEAVSFLVNPDAQEAVAVANVEDLAPGFYRSALELQGVRATAKYPLYKSSDVVGFICADYVQQLPPSDADIDILKRHAPKLEMYLHHTKKASWWKRVLGAV